MRTIIGKFNTAKVFTDLVEDTAIDQVRTLLDQPFVENETVRFMPDILK